MDNSQAEDVYKDLKAFFKDQDAAFEALATHLGTAFALCHYIHTIREFIEVPQPIIYQMALTIHAVGNFLRYVHQDKTITPSELHFIKKDVSALGEQDRYEILLESLIEMHKELQEKKGKK
jgi:hypothetical protein